ncbi:sugar transferase [uncultured Streptomyces sp.]|uniref:sugar transferase n=1 Tax=uncultured Streptomyces sp. TaxID=174707 RepID=UPI002635CB56|nr:sugar transferase [uncultured Streptomyces sp.]
MGHVEIPGTDLSGPVGLRGAPRPRTATSRNRTTALEQLWRAPTAQRDLTNRAPRAYGRARPPLPLAALAEAAGLGVPAWLVLSERAQPWALPSACLAAAAWTGVRIARGRYASRPRSDRGGLSGVLADWLVYVGLLAVAWTAVRPAVDPGAALAASVPGLLAACAVTVLVRRRAVAQRARCGQRRVLLVGAAAGVDEVAGALCARTAAHGYRVVGAVPVGAAEPHTDTPLAGRLSSQAAKDDVSTVLGGAYAQGAELVLVAPGAELTGDRLRRLGWGLHDAGLAWCVLSDLPGVAAERIRPASVAGLTLLHVSPPLRRGLQASLKSLLDRAGAGVGLLLLAPLMVAVGIGIRATSRGPVFHRQTRQGQHDRPFTMWKFRTMVQDAEARKAELITANEVDGPLFKMRRDPRITRIGRALRRTSIDELPQLFNVLLGDMSLVGPRPPLPEEAAAYDERERRRLAVKPGLTGLWQVSGRSDLSWQESVSLDLWYVDNWTVSTDMGLIARTLRAVTDGRGAY